MNPIDELITRRIDTILPTKSQLRSTLVSGKKIKLYQGFDPSRPDLHIGHLVGLLQLKDFQKLGHQVIFLIGDFTGMIGDPTDKSATRPKLTRQEVQQNAQTYRNQASRILDFDGPNPALMKFNSEWLDQLKFADLIELASNFTVQQMIERDMFQQRLKNNSPIYLHEFLYPLMVTKDAQALAVDLEIGGNDQLFNMSVGRNYLKQTINKNKFVMTTKLLTDSQGKKIGKTTGNAVNLFQDCLNTFGQIMAFPDDSIINTFTLATQVPLSEIESLKDLVLTNPMQAKKKLALEITSLCHGMDAALKAQEHFESTIQNKQLPANIPTINLKLNNKITVSDLVNIGLTQSGGELKRLIKQGGVELNHKKVASPEDLFCLNNGDIIKIGKRNYYQVIFV